MFGFGKKNKKTIETVEVKFTENGKNEPFGVTDMPVDQLPDTFEINTDITIDGETWTVLSAVPLNKEEFVEKGSLELTLSKAENNVESVDPEEILYSLPTINDEVGLMTEFMQDVDNYFPVTEDYWRQIELVCDSYDDDIDEELHKILDIHNEREEGSGFKEIHLRQIIKEPLKESEISIELLKDHFGVSKEYKGVIYGGQPFGIQNSFAFVSEDGVTLWGEYDEKENAKSICVHFSKDANINKFSHSLSEFLTESDLYFVDWCRVQKLYDEEGLAEYYEEILERL